MTLILRSRTSIFRFKAADGVNIDPAGNVRVTETVTATDESGRKTKEPQIIAMVSPADFLNLYHDDGVEIEEVVKPPSG